MFLNILSESGDRRNANYESNAYDKIHLNIKQNKFILVTTNNKVIIWSSLRLQRWKAYTYFFAHSILIFCYFLLFFQAYWFYLLHKGMNYGKNWVTVNKLVKRKQRDKSVEGFPLLCSCSSQQRYVFFQFQVFTLTALHNALPLLFVYYTEYR